MCRIQQVAEAVPVVHIHQPMHKIGLVVAIACFQFGIKRVFACRVLSAKLAWILIRLRILGSVGSRAVRIVITHRRLLLLAVAFINRDNVFLHVVPSRFQLAPIASMMAIQHLEPHPVAVSFRGGHMPVIGRFAHQCLYRMVGNAFS